MLVSYFFIFLFFIFTTKEKLKAILYSSILFGPKSEMILLLIVLKFYCCTIQFGNFMLIFFFTSIKLLILLFLKIKAGKYIEIPWPLHKPFGKKLRVQFSRTVQTFYIKISVRTFFISALSLRFINCYTIYELSINK